MSIVTRRNEIHIYIPRANTVLHVASHSSALVSETSTKVVGCGLGSLQLHWENLLLREMDLIRVNVEPSEDILDGVGHYRMASTKPEADHLHWLRHKIWMSALIYSNNVTVSHSDHEETESTSCSTF
jgi:hypothetical protein